MKSRIRKGIAYKENTIIFGKVLCTHCGSDTELIHIEMTIADPDKPWNSWETIICRDCYKDLPSIENEKESD